MSLDADKRKAQAVFASCLCQDEDARRKALQTADAAVAGLDSSRLTPTMRSYVCLTMRPLLRWPWLKARRLMDS